MIVQFDETKWNDMMAKGMVLGQLLYENDPEKLSELDVSAIKKNRVTVAQFASKKAIANTPRSPQFNLTLPQTPPIVKTSDKNSSPSDSSVQSTRSTTDSAYLDGVAISLDILLDNIDQAQYERYIGRDAQANRTQNKMLFAKSPSDSAVMSVRNTNHGKVVWIENSPIKESQLFSHQDVANYIASHIGEVYTIIESGQKVYIGKDLPGEYTQSVYTQNILKSRTLLKAKNKAVGNFGEMIEIATNRRWSKDKGSGQKDAKFGVYKYKTQFAFPMLDSKKNTVGAKAFSATLIIINSSDGKKYLYDMVGIKKSTPVTVDLTNQIIRANAAKTTSAVQNGSATTKIAQNPTVVKTSDEKSSPSDNSVQSTRATTDSAYLDGVAISLDILLDNIDQAQYERYIGRDAQANRTQNKMLFAESPSDSAVMSGRLPAINAFGEEISEANIDLYSLKQYNDFGWARVNGIISEEENKLFKSIYAKVKRGKDYANRTQSGEYMIAVGENGLQNVIIFASGSLANTKISKVIRINLYDNTAIEEITEELYEEERFGYHESASVGYIYETEIVVSYTPYDCPTYQERKNGSQQRGIGRFSREDNRNYQRKQDGRRDSSEDSETVTPSDSSVYQPRETREYTDRELLADALDSVATSEEDRKKLTQYKKKAAEADELDRTLAELRAKKKALEEAKAKRSEIRAVQDEITKTQNRITIIDKQLFNLQATVSMKRVLESEKNRQFVAFFYVRKSDQKVRKVG